MAMSNTKYVAIVPDPNRPGILTVLNDGSNIFYGSKEQMKNVIDNNFSSKDSCVLPLLSITNYLENTDFTINKNKKMSL